MNLVLTHFNQTIGPMLYLSVPDDISDEISKKIISFFNFELKEEYFEIVLVDEKLKISNLYFEIPSPWTRGRFEMVMISIITEKKFKILKKGEFFHENLNKISKRISSTKNIFKAFYKYNNTQYSDKEIDEKYKELLEIFNDSLKILEKELKVHLEPNSLVESFKKKKW